MRNQQRHRFNDSRLSIELDTHTHRSYKNGAKQNDRATEPTHLSTRFKYLRK